MRAITDLRWRPLDIPLVEPFGIAQGAMYPELSATPAKTPSCSQIPTSSAASCARITSVKYITQARAATSNPAEIDRMRAETAMTRM